MFYRLRAFMPGVEQVAGTGDELNQTSMSARKSP
jgi:hypothetical protein